MKFRFTPNPEDQCFDVRVETPDGRTVAHHARTADLLEWVRKLVVEKDCEIFISTDLNPLDTPEPRYLILASC